MHTVRYLSVQFPYLTWANGESDMDICFDTCGMPGAAPKIRPGVAFRWPAGWMVCACFLLWILSAFGASAQQTKQPPLIGPMERIAVQPIFNKNCASCHRNINATAGGPASQAGSAPSTETLSQMTPEAIYAALTTGVMAEQARNLTADQKRMIAEFFGGRPLGTASIGDAKNMSNRCSANPPMSGLSASPSWNGWGNGLDNTRYQPSASAGLASGDMPNLKLKWAFGLPGGAETYGQPAVVAGRLFFGDDNGFVYSLDAATGCVYWSFYADAQVRTAPVIGTVRGAGARYAVYFGDKKANVYAVDARTGQLIWKTNLERRQLAHITAAPVLYGGRVYAAVAGSEEIVSGDPHYPCCTYRGSLSALDARTGKLLWKRYTIPEEPRPTRKNSLGTQLWAPAGASIWSAPTIDPKRRAVYVTTGNAFTEPAAKTSDAILAYSLADGKLLWAYQAVPNDASPAGCNGPGPKGEQRTSGQTGILRTRLSCVRSQMARGSWLRRIREGEWLPWTLTGKAPSCGQPICGSLRRARPFSTFKSCGAEQRMIRMFTIRCKQAESPRCA